MIDFNMSEILILGVLAVIIFGPEKLPELARKAARVLNYVRNIANDAQGRLRQELGPEFADLEISDLNPRNLVTRHIVNPVQSELQPVRAELQPLRAELDPGRSTASSASSTRPEPAAGTVAAPAPKVVPFDTEAT